MARDHGSKEFARLLKAVEAHGFMVVRAKSGVWKITPPKGVEGPLYTTHGTIKCIKPMIRDFKKFYGIDLEA